MVRSQSGPFVSVPTSRCGRPGNARKGRSPSCARATAARLVKSVAGVEETKTCLWSLGCPKAVSVATDVRKCSSRWVQEMDLAPRRSPGVGDQVPSVNELMPGFWCSALAPVQN